MASKNFCNSSETGVFNVSDNQVREEVLAIAKELKEKNKFVDTKTYKIKCNVCYSLLKGNEEAVSHSKTTGHTNFVQLN